MARIAVAMMVAQRIYQANAQSIKTEDQVLQTLRTLAHAGYVVLSFDFPGHGRNATALGGGLANQGQMTQSLLDALSAVIALAKSLPEADGRIALLGHSMASDIVVRAGMADPSIAATIAVSLFFPGATANAPRNLLIIDGALEGRMLHDEGLKLVALASRAPPQPGTTYGRFEDGTARRLALARGVEHIGVLYARDSFDEALPWLSQAFERPPPDRGWRDLRGTALAWLFGGIVLLAWPLSTLLPRLSAPAQGAGLSRRQLLWVAGVPALLTPLDCGMVGFSYSAAIGAKVAAPHRAAISLMGDGGFGMTMGEMTTAVMSNIPAIGIVMDNGTWGSEIAYQRDFYAGRYIGAHVHSPRFDEVMKLTGGNGYHPTAAGETADALRDALKAGKPAIIHVKVDPEATISFRKDALQKRA